MDAVVLQEFGNPDVLGFERYPDPVAEPGWVVVRVRACAVNWHDVLVRRGLYNSPLPHVLGADGAGERLDTGEPVMILPSLWWGDDDSAPGDGFEILGDFRPGTHAELVRVPEECVVPKPHGLSWLEAAALPLVGVTAYRALISRGRLKPGESVLVLGAGGGLATMAISLASGIGASVVVTSSSWEKVARAKEIGATDGVLYTESDWPESAKRSTAGGRGFDLVIDSVGTWRDSLRALRPGGRLVVLGASRADSARLDVRSFYFGQFELIGTTMGSPRDFAGLLSLFDKGVVEPPVIDTVFPLDSAAAAHEWVESGEAFGKVALSVDSG